MGAFGCALYAKERANGEPSKLIPAEELENFTYTSRSANCGGCTAHCQLNIISFGQGRRFVSGNRCEKGSGSANKNTVPNLYEFKYDSILNTVKTHQPKRYRGVVGLPLALGFYEQLPFWHMLFTTLGFRTVISDESSRDMYYLGQHTIPSDTVCYPAKLTHGHIENLLDKGVDFIFYPCMSYNLDEGGSDNHFNCPVVARSLLSEISASSSGRGEVSSTSSLISSPVCFLRLRSSSSHAFRAILHSHVYTELSPLYFLSDRRAR